MRILVGFTYTLGGRDAYTLGSSLADIFDCPLDLVTIVKGGQDRAILDSTEPSYEDDVVRQANKWMDEVIGDIPARVVPSKNLRYAESYPDGLLASVEELGSTLLVIGGGRHGALGKVSLGSVGNTLLHSCPVPVALAPRGTRHHPLQRLSRVTALLGVKPGQSSAVLNTGNHYASLAESTLRLVSLLTERTDDAGALVNAEARLANARHAVEQKGGDVSEALVSQGQNIEDAVAALSWKRQELALLGSGRLAQKGRLFLGSTANKILRVLPVPLIVVPADWSPAEAQEG